MVQTPNDAVQGLPSTSPLSPKFSYAPHSTLHVIKVAIPSMGRASYIA